MRDYGYIDEVVELLAGKKKLPFIEYQPDSSWRKHTPKYESQVTPLDEETKGCTVWGWQNAFEIFEKGVYGVEPNYSEKFTYILAGVTPAKGKDPLHTVQSIQDVGLIPDEDLPMPRSLEEFIDKDDITKSLLAKGQNWLFKNELLVEEIWNVYKGTRPLNYKEVLRENLKRGPAPVSVSAWEERDGVYVSNQGGVNNHFCVALEIIDYRGYKDCVVVFDTYDHSIKVLHPDHNIRRAFAFWINKKTQKASRRHIGVLQTIINLFKKRTYMHPLKKEYPVSQKFFVPNKAYQSGVHNGIDYACPSGTLVYAPSDGEILHVFKNHKTMGNAIYFSCDDEKHYIRFLHLSEARSRGAYRKGDVIGKTGNTGQSTGNHLHVDVWNTPINTSLIKTPEGVHRYMIDPLVFFKEVV